MASSPHYLCGLGNPGPQYALTRHNVGFWLCDQLASRRRGTWSRPCELYERAEVRLKDTPLILIKPQTYMNLSGDAVVEMLRRESGEVGRLLLACDDVALPLGQIRLRQRGSDGGHNGLLSIAESLGHTNFARLRMGVGAAEDASQLSNHVLGAFVEAETPVVEEMVTRAADSVWVWLTQGMGRAMSRFNARESRESD